ncbi:hypothetical protein O9G_000178 [Rozella allomycis CSF55]|uniref:Uncharacterized protein n=1 Tax=Rozella allomycis (strain CSF55) TaxID=988480 RepID=A0A075AP33_ROZAC|nr:hypothetical protein O9G_000178 [Rozella allomycis CSF55]|eukprot:EPZ31699.1 hypothetical protein O9G_000178 [Rozella allomycis CSF55]
MHCCFGRITLTSASKASTIVPSATRSFISQTSRCRRRCAKLARISFMGLVCSSGSKAQRKVLVRCAEVYFKVLVRCVEVYLNSINYNSFKHTVIVTYLDNCTLHSLHSLLSHK